MACQAPLSTGFSRQGCWSGLPFPSPVVIQWTWLYTVLNSDPDLYLENVCHFIYIYICCCLVAKSCLTLLHPMGCSLPGLSVHGISQAKIWEWVALSFSRVYSWPRDPMYASCVAGDSLSLSHQGSPLIYVYVYKYIMMHLYMCV